MEWEIYDCGRARGIADRVCIRADEIMEGDRRGGIYIYRARCREKTVRALDREQAESCRTGVVSDVS